MGKTQVTSGRGYDSYPFFLFICRIIMISGGRMALYKYHYIELDTKRSPRISLQNIVAGETGNRLWITVTNNGETIDMSEKEDGEYIYRVCLVIKSNLGVRRQDSATEDSGISFIDANTGDHGKVNILLSKDSFTAGKNRARIEIYSKRVEEDDTLIVSAEWTFDAVGNPTGENTGNVYPLMAYWEKLCESYAHGGTGKRDGEDTDNAKYYKDLAAYYKDIALAAIDQGVVSPTVENWLDDNAERLALLKEYVTPEMYGALGDGVSDDTSAIQMCISSGKVVYGFGKSYKITSVNVPNNAKVDIRECRFIVDSVESTGTMTAFAFNIRENVNFRMTNCAIMSANDKHASNNYVNGTTSNVCMIYAGSGLDSLTLNGCLFENAYYAIYVKGNTANHVLIQNCKITGFVMGIDVAYCDDIVINNSELIQNTSSTTQSHAIYVAEGTSNRASIEGCSIDAVASCIHCNHGSSYDVVVENTKISVNGVRPFVATGSLNTIRVIGCNVSCNQQICDCSYDTLYEFIDCTITTTLAGGYIVNDSTSTGSANFTNCKFTCSLIAKSKAQFVSCTFICAANDKQVITASNLIMLNSVCKYSSTNSTPLKVNGNSKLINNVFENTNVTRYAFYVNGMNNQIKGNTFINCPTDVYPADADKTDNIFI
jgi:hypothetical protein